MRTEQEIKQKLKTIQKIIEETPATTEYVLGQDTGMVLILNWILKKRKTYYVLTDKND